MNKIKTETCFAGLKMKNPVIAASGTFGFGREYADFFDLSALGGISVKGLTLKPREGNPPPRVAETPGGILNSVGLQNPGVEAFIRDELPYLKQYNTTIFANVAGSSIDDYCLMCERLECSGIDAIELNISCPNVKEGCMIIGSDPDMAAKVTEAVRRKYSGPLVVKLTPNAPDISRVAKSVENAGADALSLINTITGMVIDVNTRRPVLANNFGGLSGPAIKPIAVRMVYEVSQAVSIPVIGMGGIACGNDAVEFLLAGASAVMIGTWSFVNPLACIDVINGLEHYMRKHNISDVKELIGGVKLN